MVNDAEASSAVPLLLLLLSFSEQAGMADDAKAPSSAPLPSLPLHKQARDGQRCLCSVLHSAVDATVAV
jgi:hypothetical protein